MYDKIITTLIATNAMKATKFTAPNHIIRVVRRKYKNKFERHTLELTVTEGKPNYAERKFIKKLKKAGESFPVKKIQLKFLPEKKKVNGKMAKK